MKKKGAGEADEVSGWLYAVVVLAVVALGIFFLWKAQLLPGQQAIERFLNFGGSLNG